MHWSMTRHATYTKCPRKFFYKEIASHEDEEIGNLCSDDSTSPPLVRHNVIRETIAAIALDPTWNADLLLPLYVQEAQQKLLDRLSDPAQAAAEASIVSVCVESFAQEIRPS